MSLKGTHIVIIVTCPSREEAENIAKELLNKKLAACINIVHPVKSMFWWKGKIDVCDETLLIIKSRIDLSRDIVEVVRKLHSYSVPEVIMLPIIGGNKDYLDWIDESVRD